MHDREVENILNDVASKKIKVGDAVKKLKFLPFEDLGFAKIDHHRQLRRGFAEVIFCKSKTKEQVLEIVKSIASKNENVLATRATEEMYLEVKKQFKNASYNKASGSIIILNKKIDALNGKVIVLSAGTSDMSVAEEAAVVAEMMGCKVERIYDVGVAGLHRLLANREKIGAASVLVVVAGMDGVLPSVSSGLFAKPIIAVPTSVGYGASFNGLAPLLTMLNSCSPGVVVVNIDNGFGAGYFAGLMCRG